MDVDGTLTDGKLYYGADGEILKAFHVHDGVGIKLLHSLGVKTAIITGRESKIVSMRAQELNIDYVYQGTDNKILAYEDLLEKLKINDKEVAYIGDDINDLPIFERVAMRIAVRNAVASLRNVADYITLLDGGNGAVREGIEYLMSKNMLGEVKQK